MKKITIEYKESKKAELFIDFFVNHLLPHIEYSNKQYGDVGEDVVTKWSSKQCMVNVARYCERFENNARKGQERLDLIKGIDYLIRIFYKDDYEITEETNEAIELLRRIYNYHEKYNRPLETDIVSNIKSIINDK